MNKTPSIKDLIPPHKKNKGIEDYNFWADYIELVCLFHPDGEVSQNDILDKIREIADDYIDGEHDRDDFAASELNSKWENLAAEWFSVLSSRKVLFSNFYPFNIINGMLVRTTRITKKRNLYITLLFSSNLEYLTNSTSKLTSSFECISKTALKTILPSKSKVYLFGKNPKGSDRYKGNVIAKIKKLAKDLGNLKVVASETDFSNFSTGDAGLDIVAWIELESYNKHNIPIFLGQCACGKNWKNKISSSEYGAWSEQILFKSITNNVIFIPYSYRKINGQWFKSNELRKSILIDRNRIINQHKELDLSYIDDLPSYKIVNEILETRTV